MFARLRHTAEAVGTAGHLYRDTAKQSPGTMALTPDALITSFTDTAAVPALPSLQFYRLTGLPLCLFTPGPC